MLCKHRFPCNTLTHSTNEDLLNIKRKCDPEVSYSLSYARYHWNPEHVCNESPGTRDPSDIKQKNPRGHEYQTSLIQSSCRSFIRAIVPSEISKVNFRVETKILDNFQMREHSWPCRFHIRYKTGHHDIDDILLVLYSNNSNMTITVKRK
jgi:hypothetical protein